MPGHGIVILAAGGSTRMGRPKQLLDFRGKSLLRRAIEVATEVALGPVAVVLGAAEHEIRLVIPEGVCVYENEQWNEGMGTSIRTGLNRLIQQDPELTGIVLFLCDQPLVTAASIRRLVKVREDDDKTIAAAEYGGTLGTPAWFGREVFHELLALPDDQGAKRVILSDPSRVIRVPMPEAELDIDTPEQYQSLGG